MKVKKDNSIPIKGHLTLIPCSIPYEIVEWIKEILYLHLYNTIIKNTSFRVPVV